MMVIYCVSDRRQISGNESRVGDDGSGVSDDMTTLKVVVVALPVVPWCVVVTKRLRGKKRRVER